MQREAHTIVLPEDAPQSKILDTVNLSRGEDAPIRILGLIDACGYDGQVFVHLEPGISMETVRNQITHCCQNSQGKKWWHLTLSDAQEPPISSSSFPPDSSS